MAESIDRISCLVCQKEQAKGIKILDEFICEDCEQDIVNTKVEDERYPQYVIRMRNLWKNRETTGERGL
ncbi:sigma factor G inhibitor Gin [Desmospora activa]|uniref:Inhibitor of sigma-G Gin protein n=1 Tax=Desmospora activa DSM 45169 TaxID=1121389 RepID=A0A2T4Z275_9BACL|nr:sigma factor G inhibitor Gin [Desmospora activa]PTM54851.1 inhibitor of sigma-G Gin protein [Desmospora activa DSM 45169]